MNFLQPKIFFLKHHTTWPLNELTTPIILCMTDALGEWALRNAECSRPVWVDLATISNPSDLEMLIIQERDSKNMRIDDSTLLRISLQIIGQNDISKS